MFLEEKRDATRRLESETLGEWEEGRQARWGRQVPTPPNSLGSLALVDIIQNVFPVGLHSSSPLESPTELSRITMAWAPAEFLEKPR